MKRELLVGHDKTVAEFVARLSPIERPDFKEGYTAIGILRDDGALIAGVVFSNWRSAFRTLELSGAAVSSQAFSRENVAQLYGFAFRQLEANRLWARTAAKNRRAIKFLKHIGFTHEGDLADYYGPGTPAGTYRMLRREWLRKYDIKAAA